MAPCLVRLVTYAEEADERFQGPHGVRMVFTFLALEKAIETQSKAISLLPDEKTPFRADLEARLAEFEASRAETSE